MTITNEERIFKISKKDSYTEFIIKDNQLISVTVVKGEEIYTVYRNGFWHYYNNKDKINIRPKKKGLYHINGEYNSAFKIYCKACIIETECENIWKYVLKFVKHAKLIW